MTDTIRLLVCRVFRDYPNLRTIDMREAVLKKVREVEPKARWSTVERHCRNIQNKDNLYPPLVNDGRRKYEKMYFDRFSTTSER